MRFGFYLICKQRKLRQPVQPKTRYPIHLCFSDALEHAEFYQVARDIALGMNYLHSHKPEVLHLDLKSMNVLLCQSFRAKIADFGFSKLRYFSFILDHLIAFDRLQKYIHKICKAFSKFYYRHSDTIFA